MHYGKHLVLERFSHQACFSSLYPHVFLWCGWGKPIWLSLMHLHTDTLYHLTGHPIQGCASNQPSRAAHFRRLRIIPIECPPLWARLPVKSIYYVRGLLPKATARPIDAGTSIISRSFLLLHRFYHRKKCLEISFVSDYHPRILSTPKSANCGIQRQ